MEKKQLIERILLNMNYNSSKTYSENLENVQIVEQSSFLSKQQQDNLISSVGSSWGDVGVSQFKVKTQDEWYAVYAVWLAQTIETMIAEKIGYGRTNVKCKDSTGKLRYPQGNKNLTQALSENLIPKKTTKFISWEDWTGGYPAYMKYEMCINEKIVFDKPFNKINWDNLRSESGRLTRNSFKGYNGYIPSFAEVTKAYGPLYNKFIEVFSKFSSGDLLNLRFEPKSSTEVKVDNTNKTFTGNKVDLDSVHDFLTVLQIGLLFTGPVGWLADALITTGESFMFAIEEEIGLNKDGEEMAAFLLVLQALPAMKLFKGASQVAKEVQQSLYRKMAKGQFSNFSNLEMQFLNDLARIDIGSLSREARNVISKKISEALSTPSNLSKETISSLKEIQRKLTSKWIGRLDTVLSIAASFALTEKGRQFATSLFQMVFDSGADASDDEITVIIQEIKQQNDAQTQAIHEEIKKNPENATKYVKDKNYRQKMQKRYENVKVTPSQVSDTTVFTYPKNYNPYEDN
jgi:hypothetical protein